jgi:hypothetical protein
MIARGADVEREGGPLIEGGSSRTRETIIIKYPLLPEKQPEYEWMMMRWCNFTTAQLGPSASYSLLWIWTDITHIICSTAHCRMFAYICMYMARREGESRLKLKSRKKVRYDTSERNHVLLALQLSISKESNYSIICRALKLHYL